MKNNILKLALALLVVFTYTSCEEDLLTFDPINGQSAYSFGQTSYSLSIPQEDLVLTIPVSVTTVSTQDRNVSVSVDAEGTTGEAGEYSLGSIVIPAGSYSGSLDVTFDFSAITGEDGDVKNLVFSINPDSGDTAYFETVEIEYFREIVCNDMNLLIVSDVWATETSFDITDADGNVVIAEFFPWTINSTQPQTFEADFFLPDGDYIFTLYDSYGDGQQGTGGGVTLTGNYALTCSIIIHASGEGELTNGSFESTAFSVNP